MNNDLVSLNCQADAAILTGNVHPRCVPQHLQAQIDIAVRKPKTSEVLQHEIWEGRSIFPPRVTDAWCVFTLWRNGVYAVASLQILHYHSRSVFICSAMLFQIFFEAGGGIMFENHCITIDWRNIGKFTSAKKTFATNCWTPSHRLQQIRMAQDRCQEWKSASNGIVRLQSSWAST